MALGTLRKSLKKAKKSQDDFMLGTVIRWAVREEFSAREYTYVAVKTPVGWYTSARDFNTHVPQCVTYDELNEILSRREVKVVELASQWAMVIENT